MIMMITLIFVSCDLTRDPYDQISVEDLFADPGAIESATVGNYALLKGDLGYDGWIDQLHRISEYAGDNVALSGTTTDAFFYLYNYQSITTNGRVASFWRSNYKLTVGCNTIIEKLEEGASEETDQLLGENYYLRALAYFQMGNVFGRPYNQRSQFEWSVPLKLTSDTEDRPDRNTIEEVYAQVISDLEKAESLMTINKGPSYASKYAAEALLSRVYLYMEDNDKAIEYADKVINSGEYQLLMPGDFAKMNTLRPDQNREAIFAVTLVSSADLPGQDYDWGTIGSMYVIIDNVGYGEMYASSTYLDLLNKNPTDLRKNFIEPQYLRDDEGKKIPAVYWVDENENNYQYVFAHTTENNGVITFEYNGITYELKSEDVDGRTVYYFDGPYGRQDVTYDYDMEKRNGYPKFYVLKCSLQENDLHMWSPMVSRLAEIYLNKAEALAKNGMDKEAIDIVNIIRQRANIPEYDPDNLPADKSALDLVLEERRLELAYEGHRRFDVFRNGRTMNRRYPGTHLIVDDPFYEIPANHNRVVELLPEEQLVLQPNLIQNP
jgi:tetratricopeptide (TPR) repeat protein